PPCFPRNSPVPSDGEIQCSKGGFSLPLSTVTRRYVLFSGRIATRFCSFDCAGDGLVSACAFARSSGRTDLALRTSGSVDTRGTAVGAIDGAAEAVGAEATLGVCDCAVVAGAVVELGLGVALGETWAVSAARGAIRRRFMINFIAEKPITNTRIPKISGIGDTRSLLDRLDRLKRLERLERRTSGALTGFAGGLS